MTQFYKHAALIGLDSSFRRVSINMPSLRDSRPTFTPDLLPDIRSALTSEGWTYSKKHVNFRANNRRRPRDSRCCFQLRQVLAINCVHARMSLESRRDGICVEKRSRPRSSPVGAAFEETLPQQVAVKIPKLTPMVWLGNRPYRAWENIGLPIYFLKLHETAPTDSEDLLRRTDGIECLITPQIERAIHENGRCSDDLSHRVACNNFKFTARLHNSDHTVPRCEIDESVRIDR